MHKIFKLCGSPSEDYWQRSRLPHATSFKPHRRYKRCVAETFKDFPASALALVDKLFSVEPENRGSAASALGSEVTLSSLVPLSPSPELLRIFLASFGIFCIYWIYVYNFDYYISVLHNKAPTL